ncbi:hypothetical protein [Fibrobacter succinogenes]|uniref:hypothetical protein n=1 Tax=Fibrobacter succinogenes TaxID=833 RepID=UPI001564DD6C|nr:hypothetical protein [Fibrobacter succinogenes]
MRYSLLGILGFAVMLVACTHTVSAPKDDESSEISSSSKKVSSSESKESEKGSSSSSGKQAKSSSSDKTETKKSSSSASDNSDCVGESGEPWDGTTAKDFACGAGTKLSPYIILTAEQLAHLSFVVNSSDKAYQGKYFKLGADIKLNKGDVIDDKGALVGDSTKLHKWTPIGNSSVGFDGNFDGDGHTVRGMFINTTSTHNGLFGNNQGQVLNLFLKDSWVSGGKNTAGIAGNSGGSIAAVQNFASVTGTENIGGIAGQSNGPYPQKASIRDCHNYGAIKGKNYIAGIVGLTYNATLDSCKNYGYIEGEKYVAGVAGKGAYSYVSSYTINSDELVNIGDVIGKIYVGGVFGSCGGDYCSGSYKCGVTTNLLNVGKIVGEERTAGIAGHYCAGTLKSAGNQGVIEGKKYTAGIAGYLSLSTTSSIYNVGTVVGSMYVGGIIGDNEEGVTSSAYSTGKVDGDSLVGLMIGYNYNTTMADYYYLEQGEQEPFGLNNGGGVATPKTADEMKSDDFAALLGDEFAYDSELNDGYPVLKWEME